MATDLTIQFVLPGTSKPVADEDGLWGKPLPDSPATLAQPEPQPAKNTITYRDYFTAAKQFLKREGCAVLTGAISSMQGHPVGIGDILNISVGLEKHGAVYHPARVHVQLKNKNQTFVLNVATTPEGDGIIENEYRLLRHLYRGDAPSFLPRCFFLDRLFIPSGKTVSMFLGEWFEGFFEFHPSHANRDSIPKLKLWDTEKGSYYLTHGQSLDVYRQAAMILTFYYNPDTAEQIFSWHHAAGDFIVKPLKSERVDARLITVRQYLPLFQNLDQNAETLMEALRIFLLKLSIKNRVDRMDGVGKYTWAPYIAVRGTVEGFFSGLHMKVQKGELSGEFPVWFHRFLLTHPKEEWHELAVALMDHYGATHQEIALIQPKLKNHISELCDAIQESVPF